MPAKDPAAYMRARRARGRVKQEEEDEPEEIPNFFEEDDEDRRRGLPRSNYYGNWVPVIQAMPIRLIDRILSDPRIINPKKTRHTEG